MKDDNSYTYCPFSNEFLSKFKIFVGTENFVEQQLQEINSQLPEKYTLFQNYPNPFNSTTTIKFELPKNVHIKLSLYNTIGEELKIITHGEYGAGNHKVLLNADELSSGLYFYKLETGGFVGVKKFLVLK